MIYAVFRPLILGILFLTLSACGGGGAGAGAGGSSTPEKPVVIIDTDKDGVADSVDAAPNDPLCSAASDANAGICYLRTLASSRLKIVGNAEGKIFFNSEDDALRLYAYDLKTKHFLGRVNIQGFTPVTYAYSPDHGRLYVGDTSGKIHSYTESLQENASVFASLKLSVTGLVAVGKYLLAQDDSGAWATHYVFDKLGQQTDSKDWNYFSSYYEWNQAQSRIYFFRDDSSPNDLMFEIIDQATGKISGNGESPYHGSYTIQGPIRTNQSGSKVLLGSGDIYNAPSLTWYGNLGTSLNNARWIANDELVTLKQSGTTTRLSRYDLNKTKVEELLIEGEVMDISVFGGSNYLIIKKATQIEISNYVPSNDSDGDGVTNLLDKFPLDKTAADDSDNDGYPDAFLNGYTAADSPTGLSKDAYPLDANCHALAQGDGVNCNFALVMPAYVPDQILSDGQDIVYLLSKANNRVYRWSKNKGDYISPLVVGQKSDLTVVPPTTITYSQDHNRLYLGYATGAISYINSIGDTKEFAFAATAQSVQGLAPVGKYLLAQDPSGAWSSHYIFDKQGNLTDSKEWNYFSRYYDWNASQSRVYFFRDDQSPNDLMYENIDQSTGKITSSGESPYHGDFGIRGPIRVSLGGGRIIIGTGDIYSASDLKVVKSLGFSFQDAQWLDDGSLVTMAVSGIDTNVALHNANFAFVKNQKFVGSPIALQKFGNNFIVITQVDGKPKMNLFSL